VTAADGFDLGQGGVVLLEEHVVQLGQLGGGVDDVLDGQHPGADLGEAEGVLRSWKTAMSMFSVGETTPS
jgi:hypothetical protein